MRYTGPGEKQFIEQKIEIVGDTVVIEAPMYLRSHANSQCHWALRAQRVKADRQAGYALASLGIRKGIEELSWAEGIAHKHWTIKLVRVAPRRLDSGDNLNAAFKHIRDGIADAYGQNDSDYGGLRWEYDQQQRKAYGVRIELKRLSGT